MAIGTILTQFGNRNTNMPSFTSRHAPMINSLILPHMGSGLAKNTLVSKKKRLMKWYLTYSTELTALVNMVAGDICEASYYEPVNEKDSGRNKILKAEAFAEDINIRQVDVSSVIDILATGEAYGWIGKIDMAKVNALVSKRMKERELPVEFKEMYFKANFSDEDTVKSYNYIASSTVENIFNEHEITGFIQKVGQENKPFTRAEVIHYQFLNVDGRPEGFTPIDTLVTQLEFLRFIWANMHSIAKNGGQMDKIYSVEDIDINSPAFKRIEQEFKKYHKMENRHGSILVNGKFNIHDLQALDTMQFKDAGLYITGLIGTHWRIPKSRIGFIVGDANTKDDTGGNAEKAYSQNIEMLQDLYLNLQNKYLWIPYFGVRRKFKKAYKHDELVEVQTKQQRLNNLTFQSNELAKNGKRMKWEYKIRFMNGVNEPLSAEDLEDIPKEEMFPEDNGMFRQNMSSNDDLKKSDSDKNKGAMKRNEKLSSQRNTGSPSGFGKEDDKPKFDKYPYVLS